MYELLTAVGEMRAKATVMKRLIVSTPLVSPAVREAMYALEAAIYVMERAATDAYEA